MAFVYRSKVQKNKEYIQTSPTVGPGSYINKKDKRKESPKTSSPAPFNNTEKREIWKKNGIPGPGAYRSDITNNILKEKVLLTDRQGDFVVYDTPKQSGAFKSKTKRFWNDESNNDHCSRARGSTGYLNESSTIESPKRSTGHPGPGQYNIDSQNMGASRHRGRNRQNGIASGAPSSSKSNLKKFLKYQNRYGNDYQIPQDQIMAVSSKLAKNGEAIEQVNNSTGHGVQLNPQKMLASSTSYAGAKLYRSTGKKPQPQPQSAKIKAAQSQQRQSQPHVNSQAQSQSHPRHSTFFSSKVKRQDSTFLRPRPQTSAGPGSYNLSQNIDKSCTVISATTAAETESKAKGNKKQHKNANNSKNNGNGSFGKQVCLNRQQVTTLSSQLGPGCYQIQEAFDKMKLKSSIKSSSAKTLHHPGSTKPYKGNLQCFGSTVDRFQVMKNDIQVMSPGPAAYENIGSSSITLSTQKHHLKRPSTANTVSRVYNNMGSGSNSGLNINTTVNQSSFNADTGKFNRQKRNVFNITANNTNPNISPGVYQAQHNLTTLLKQKFKKRTAGSFGSTQQRFVERCISPSSALLTYAKDENDQKQNATNKKFKRLGMKNYIKRRKQNEANSTNQINNYSFKQNKIGSTATAELTVGMSSSLTNISHNDDDIGNRPNPPVVSHDAQINTIGWKYSKKWQADAPFMSGSHRFSILMKQSAPDQQKKSSLRKTSTKGYSKNNKRASSHSQSAGGFIKFSQPRFKYENSTEICKLGPQSYNPIYTDKQKSYNVLFS